MSPCDVAGLGKGATLTGVPRLAERRPTWRHLAQQRIALKRQQTL